MQSDGDNFMHSRVRIRKQKIASQKKSEHSEENSLLQA